MTNKEIYIFKTKTCEWCDDIAKIMAEIGMDFNLLDIEKNGIALGLAKKICGGEHPCLVVNGREIKPEINIVCDEILENSDK